MKKNLEVELNTRYERYLAQVRSYCEVVGMKFVQPTISQFLAANALTRDRLLGDEPKVTSTKAGATKQVAETNMRPSLISFANYVREQEHNATK